MRKSYIVTKYDYDNEWLDEHRAYEYEVQQIKGTTVYNEELNGWADSFYYYVIEEE